MFRRLPLLRWKTEEWDLQKCLQPRRDIFPWVIRTLLSINEFPSFLPCINHSKRRKLSRWPPAVHPHFGTKHTHSDSDKLHDMAKGAGWHCGILQHEHGFWGFAFYVLWLVCYTRLALNKYYAHINSIWSWRVSLIGSQDLDIKLSWLYSPLWEHWLALWQLNFSNMRTGAMIYIDEDPRHCWFMHKITLHGAKDMRGQCLRADWADY